MTLDFWKGVGRRFVYIVRHSRPDYFEFQSGLLAIILALWLVLPGNDPAGGASNMLEHVMSPRLFGIAAEAIGLFQLTAVLLLKLRTRRMANVMAGLFWASSGTVIALGNWHLLIVPVFFLLALQSARGFWRSL